MKLYRTKLNRFFIVLSFGILPAASACAQWAISASAGLQQTELKEYGIDGRELVREHGWMPGVEVRAEYRWRDWRFGVDGSTYRQTIAYEGHLQNGGPFATDTHATQDRFGVDADYRLSEAMSLIGGIEWEHRGRRIVGRGVANGLDERSTSWRLLAGGNVRLAQYAAAAIDARALFVFAQAEQLDVRFDRHAYDDASFATRPSVGVRTALTVTSASMPNLSAGLAFDWMKVRRSDDAVLRKDGIVAGTVAQPEHRRRSFTAFVAYRFD